MKKLRIGLVGLGVVGKSVYEILVNQKEIIGAKSANKLELVAVCARSKKDFVDETKVKYVTNPLDLALDKEIDIIVEVAGDAPNIREMWVAALKNGKKIVTANKALFATKGLEMTKLAEENGGYIAFEASVAGAIPIIKLFKEGFAANKINAFYGILNGTSNYILTKMKDENIDFSVALKQAQDAGYAEADPSFDIEGTDVAHKLTILAAIAESAKPAFSETYVEGITQINIDDIKFADEFGYKIKLLAIYKNGEKASQQTVYPALVEKSEKIASVDDSFNAIFTQGSNFGDSFIVGRGAGGFQTASSVVSDLIDIANDRHSFEFGVKSDGLKSVNISKIEDRIGQYFIRFSFDKNADKENILDKNFLEKIKVEKSYFYEKEEVVVCGVTSGQIIEKDLKNLLNNLDKNSIKDLNFIRVEKIC